MAVELPQDTDPTAVVVTLIGRTGVWRGTPQAETPRESSRRVGVFRFSPPVPTTSRQELQLLVEIGGRVSRRLVTYGAGAFSGEIEAIRDYRLEGWVSPLFEGAGPFEIRLVVDGVAALSARPNRFRPDLVFSEGCDGWLGFSFALPSEVLDEAEHSLTVEAGDVSFTLPRWSARPEFHIDEIGPHRLGGWFFDRGLDNSPVTMGVRTAAGRQLAAVPTHFRPDLKEIFGREEAAFLFQGRRLELAAGQELVAGAEGGGLLIGRIRSDGPAAEVDALRARARSLLLSGPPLDTAAEREALGPALSAARSAAAPGLVFRRAIGAGAPASSDLLVAPAKATAAACVIVPAYKGFEELRACIASLLPQLEPGRLRAVVIDDMSPDPALRAYVATLATETYPGLAVLANDRNLGFIGTVNRGFEQLRPGEDAIIVNADTVLPPGALARLAGHCRSRPGIASVTPMSNNATILSFPSSPEPSPPAFGCDATELDRAFAAVGSEPIEIPTGIGFCMYLNREALDEVGSFSPAWGRGYCEEVEWSLVARDLGWIHLAATDTFVTHSGSTSFGVEQREAILSENHAKLEAIFPEHVDQVREFIETDPLETVRVQAMARLLASRYRRLTIHVDHGLGGGTKRYIDDLLALPRSPDHEVGALSPVVGDGRPVLSLVLHGSQATLRVTEARLRFALDALEAAGLDLVVHVNARLGHTTAVLNEIASGRRPYLVTLHDYQWYCPQVHLTDERETYCGEPPPAVCQQCARHKVVEVYDFRDQNGLIQDDLPAWLAYNERFLRGAKGLMAPSRDTAERYARRLGLSAVVSPHVDPARSTSPAAPRQVRPTGSLRIAAVGGIGPHKGFDLLMGLAEHGARHALPFSLQVIGYTTDDKALTRFSNASVTGRYDPASLKRRLDAFGPDFVFLSSVWPETYSYVLSEVWDAGYPVVAFDIGAPAERIRASGGGVLLPLTRDPVTLYAELEKARDQAAGLALPNGRPGTGLTLERYYRVSEASAATEP